MTVNLNPVLSSPEIDDSAIRQTIQHYFDAFNAEQYAAIAQLFADDGVLYPPFEAAVVGREAIAAYLMTEAPDMRLSPLEAIIDTSDDNGYQVKVVGKVQTPLFGVNVAWYFTLNFDHQITSVGVNLLASLEQLLKLRREPGTVNL